jgi:hypothetical protein
MVAMESLDQPFFKDFDLVALLQTFKLETGNLVNFTKSQKSKLGKREI